MKLMSIEELRTSLVPVSRVTLNMMVERGEFVQPVQVAGRLLFVEAEVLEWLASQPRGLFQQAPGLKRYQEERKAAGQQGVKK